MKKINTFNLIYTFLILTIQIILSFFFFNCTAPSIPSYNFSKFEKYNLTLAIKPFADKSFRSESDYQLNLTTNEKIVFGEEDLNAIINMDFEESNLFDKILIYDSLNYDDYDFILEGELLGIKYYENPSVGTFFHPYNLLSYLVFAGGIAVSTIDQAPDGIGPLFMGLGALGFAGTTFLFKSEYNHTFESFLNYKLTNAKTKEIILNKTIRTEYSKIYSRHIEDPAGSEYIGPYVIHKTKMYSYDTYDVNHKLSAYVLHKSVSKMLKQIKEEISNN